MTNRPAAIFRHWPWILTLGLGIGAGGFAVYGKAAADKAPEPEQAQSLPQAGKPAAISVATVVRREIVQSLAVTGSLVARDEVLVGAQIDGVRLEAYLADVGDRVEEGQVLARLDRAMLETRLAQNASEIAKANASAKQAEALITELEANLTEARLAEERARRLNQTGTVSSEMLQSRQTSLQVAQARLAAQRENLVFAEAAKAYAVEQSREIALNLSRTEVRAPAAGIISARNANVGQSVGTSADPLFRIIRDGAIELEADVVEGRLDTLDVGQPVVLTLAGEAPISGEVRLVAPSVDPASRLGKVRIALQPNPALRPGRFVTATIEIRRRDGLVVPASAILFGIEGARVQVVADGRVSTRAIVAGLSDAAGTEVTNGLTSGEDVVVRAGGFLRDGDRITPVYPVKSQAMNSPARQSELN